MAYDNDKYQFNRQTAYDLLKQEGYTDIGDNAEDLFKERGNAELAYHLLRKAGYTDLGKNYGEFAAMLYGPESSSEPEAFSLDGLGENDGQPVAPSVEIKTESAPEKNHQGAPFVPLNLPYGGEFQPETAHSVQVPNAPDNADEMAAENERARAVAKYAPGRLDDQVLYVNPSDELILDNASKGKGYSVDNAIAAGLEYEKLLDENNTLNERIKRYNEEDARLKSAGTPTSAESLARLRAHQDEYTTIDNLVKQGKERYSALMATPAGRELELLQAKAKGLQAQPASPERDWELARVQAQISRNPIARVTLGDQAPSESQIAFDLNRGEVDYIESKMDNADRKQKKAYNDRLKELQRSVLDNTYYQSDVARRIKEVELQIAADKERMLHIEAEVTKGMSIPEYMTPGSVAANKSKEYNNLAISVGQREMQLRKLEHIRDKNAGDFWVNFLDVFADPNTYTFGATNLSATLAARNAMENPTMQGADELIAAVAGYNAATAEEGQYVESKGRYGQIAANSIPFMAQIALTGGFSGVAKGVSGAVTKGVAKTAAKRLGKEAAERISEHFAVKATGAVLGDMAAGLVAANTVGGAKTANDILTRYYGTIAEDQAGKFVYQGGMDLGRAIWKSEISNALEYSSERFGDHLQHLIGRGILQAGINSARKAGRGNINLAVEELAKTMDVTLKDFGLRSANKAGANWAQKAMSGIIDISNRAGVQGLPFEVMEEYVGLLGNIILGGEEKWMDFSKFGDKETHTDIWGGMLYSIGLTQAGTLALGGVGAAAAGIEKARQFQMLENTLDATASAASEFLGKDDWQMVKSVIDGSTNQELPSKVVEFMDSQLWNDQQKAAILDYIKTTYIYRGFNAGTISQARERLMSEDNLASLNIDAEVASAQDQLADAYMLGYNSSTAKRIDVEQADIDARSKRSALDAIMQKEELEKAVARQKERIERKTGMVDVSEEVANGILSSETAPRDVKDAALDYLMARAVERGFDDAEENRQIRTKAAILAQKEKNVGGKFYYETPFGDSEVQTALKKNALTGTLENVYILSGMPNEAGEMPYRSETGELGFIKRDGVGTLDANGVFVPGQTNVQTLNDYMDEQYLAYEALREAQLAQQDSQDTKEREDREEELKKRDAQKNAHLSRQNVKETVKAYLDKNDGEITINGISGSITHETEDGATFIPDDGSENQPMSWEEIASGSGILERSLGIKQSSSSILKEDVSPVVGTQTDSENNGGTTTDVEQGIPIDKKTGKKLYDAPGVTTEEAYNSLYLDKNGKEKEGVPQENADSFVIRRSDAANKALADTQQQIAEAEIAKAEIDKWKLKGDEDLDDLERRQERAKAKIDEQIANAISSLPELQRKAAFWSELRDVAQDNIDAREAEAKRQELIKQYGVDISKLHDLDTPLSLEEAVAEYLGNSTHLINAADAEKEWLGKGNTNAGEIFRHRGPHGILTLNGGQTVRAVAEDIVGEYEDLNLDEQKVFDEILNQLDIHTKSEMKDVIFQNRLKEAIAAKEAAENAPAELEQQIAEARKDVDTNPSDAQKDAGNYKKGHITLDGYDISIENPKGSVRSGTDANGNEWYVTMNNDYGYFLGTEGVDGDHIDVFLSDHPGEGKVYVIDQVKEDGSFDEHKVMYGFNSEEEARNAYLANYSPGWKGLGAITEVSKEDFKTWVDSSHRKTKPFAEYKSVKESTAKTKDNIPASEAVEEAPEGTDTPEVETPQAPVPETPYEPVAEAPSATLAPSDIVEIYKNREQTKDADKGKPGRKEIIEALHEANPSIVQFRNEQDQQNALAEVVALARKYPELEISKDILRRLTKAERPKDEPVEESTTAVKKTSVQTYPANLRAAYESGDSEQIAAAEKALADFINSSDSVILLRGTENLAKSRKMQAEKDSAEYKLQDFIAKTIKSRLAKMDKAVVKAYDDARKIYEDRFTASKEDLESAIAYFEGERETAQNLLDNAPEDADELYIIGLKNRVNAANNHLEGLKQERRRMAEEDKQDRQNDSIGEDGVVLGQPTIEEHLKEKKDSISDDRIEDFGEKIGGARKDTYRARIQDSVKLTPKDLKSLKDPDKILPRKRIISLIADGSMTKEDGQTLLALNMAVRGMSDQVGMKTLGLIKYRDLAATWEKGEPLSVGITENDIDFLVDQLRDEIKSRPNIREKERDSLETLFLRLFEDYKATYQALDYPGVYRALKSAYIRYGAVDGRYWVVGGPGATRGYPFGSMDKAVAKMESIYPVVKTVDAKKDNSESSEEDKFGSLIVVKDDNGWYRVKSRAIPGKIYLSKKFYSKAEAEKHLKDNAPALVDREQKMVEALLGSNIGSVQRVGRDYRNGKDVTPDEMLETFGFRGVEFGNWVPQAERQEYLNKTYDAIMDFCEIVGISPKAFSLGGRLGLAFGARGHSRALAHYEPMKEVINLTRMKGAGSLAHEWFHALDNYLAKQKTGNTSDMATDTKDVVREELANAFKEFVGAMNKMDYSQRSRRAGDYWGEVWERAARLFESYVFNSLAERGAVSPLLVRKDTLFDDVASEDSTSSSWPYPSIAENEQIKPYFDRLFGTIEEKAGPDGNLSLYRRGRLGLPNNLKEADERINKIADILGVKYKKDNTIRGKGQFVPSTGEILINFEAHSDVSDLESTLLHEAVAHYGLRKLFGEQFHELMALLYNNAAEEIKANVDEIAKKENLSMAVAMEEYLAELAEKGDFNEKEESFWRQVVNALKALFAKLGFGENLTEEDMRALLYASYRNLQKRGAIESAARLVTYQALREKAEASHREELNNPLEEGFVLSPTGEQPLNRLREKEAPARTKKVYKLMRLGIDGKLYPLFIDSITPIELGRWYDADSPDLAFLKKMPSGVFLVNPADGTYTSLEDYAKERGFKAGKFPPKEAINEAGNSGMRWVRITDTENGQRRYEGESRKYENIGINGSGGVSTFAMRPGWHAGSLPTMRQIGKGANKNLRDDSFVWVEGEVSADVDYNDEAQGNPDKDIPTHIPTDGYYVKATNANKAASQADRVGWYVAGSFKPVRIISDAEARAVIDDWNQGHPNQAPVEYDWPRESGEDFTPESELDEISINNANFAQDEDEILRSAGMDSSDGNQDGTRPSDQRGLGKESGTDGLDGGPRGHDRGAVVPGLFGEDQGSAGAVGEHEVATEQRQGDKRYSDGRTGKFDIGSHPVESVGRGNRSDSRSDEDGELAQSGRTDGRERSRESDGLPGAVQSGDVRRRVLPRTVGRGLRGLLSYIQHSKSKSLGSVAPAAIAESMDNSLSEIEKQYGGVDEFVKDELGYDSMDALYNALSAEQIDGVAMAIYQMKKGQAMIIGDQTGVGKGRQMAALIRWARRQDKKPVFFTNKDTLFSDLYRDMKDTGSGELRPLIINADRTMVDEDGNEVYTSPTNAELNAIMQEGVVPKEYDYVVLTYSQLSSGDSQSRAEKNTKTEGKGRAMSKAEFIRKISANNYLLCDESHTAAGQGQTGAFMRSIIPSAGGVTFASATFAKRPDSMPLYAIKSAISEAKVGPLELIEMVKRGGLILQEIMSRELAKAGQMVRRQRLMDDVETEWKTVSTPELAKKAKAGYNAVIDAYNAIITFQRKHGGRVYLPNTYNFTRQLMLALKVDAIVEEALSEIKAGRKPLIALENTLESAISEYPIGAELSDATFAPTILSMLPTTNELDEDGKREYKELLNKIKEATKDIPASPIDAIIEKLEAHGYKVGEITRRSKKIQTKDGKAVITRHKEDNIATASAFNKGDTDVLILNRSGATGISLHASETFKDQRPRTMIIAQPLGDINEYQQMLGRIDRTGQVHRGRYINLSLPIPAEQRFNMMLANKLRSLSANTTTESESGNIDAPDLLNKYGAKVMCEFLQDNPDIFNALGVQLGYKAHPVRTVEDLDEYTPVAEDAEKITGALALLPVDQQQEFYEGVTSRYQELINSLDEAGLNDLSVKTLPLRAKTISKEVGTKGKDSESSNPFAQDSFVEKVEVDVLTKPMSVSEIEAAREKLGGESAINRLRERVSDQKHARLEAEDKRYNEAIAHAKKQDLPAIEERHESIVARINRVHDSIVDNLERFSTQQTYLVPEEFGMDAEDKAGRDQAIGSVPGVLLGFKIPKEGAPVTPSTITVVFATLDGRRKVEVKLSDSFILDDIESQTNEHPEDVSRTTLDNWDSSIPNETREERYVLTGNVLQAWADVSNGGILPGKLVSFTDEEGNVRDGILMNKSWKPSTSTEAPSTPISEHLQDILDGKVIKSIDGKVQIQKGKEGYYKGKIFIVVPKAVKDGGAIAKDRDVLGVVGTYGFSTHNYNFKLATVNPKKLPTLLQILSDKYDVRVGEEIASDDDVSANEKEEKRFGYSGIEDKKNGEQPHEFFMRVVNAVLSKYKGLDPKKVFVSPSLLKLAPEAQDKRKNGSFNPQTKEITIFVKTNKKSADEIERTIFHEALHMALDKLGWKRDSMFVKAFNAALVASGYFSSQEAYDKAYSRLKSAYEKEKGRRLTEGELLEEMLTQSLSAMMQNGRAKILIDGAKTSGYEAFADDIEKLLNVIQYESEKEFNARADEKVRSALSGQSWEQNEIQAGRVVSDSDGRALSEDGRTPGRRESERTSAGSSEPEIENLKNPITRARSIVEASRLSDSLGVKFKEDPSMKEKCRFDSETNTVYINIDRHDRIQDIKRSVFYEALTHLGMDAVYGEEWSDVRRKLYEDASDNVRTRIDSIAEIDKLATGVALEKYFVQLIEDGTFSEDEDSFYEAMKNAVSELFKRYDLAEGPYSASPEYVLYSSYNNAQRMGAVERARVIVTAQKIKEDANRQSEEDGEPEDDDPGTMPPADSIDTDIDENDSDLFELPLDIRGDASDLMTEHDVDDIIRETEDYVVAETAADVYERRTASPWQNMRSQLVEEYQPLLNLIRAILNWNGDVRSKDVSSLKDDERVIERLHEKASSEQYENEKYSNNFFRPMMDAIGRFMKKANRTTGSDGNRRLVDKGRRIKMKDMIRYACLKSSLDRNEAFAKRDAKIAAKKSYENAYAQRKEELDRREKEEKARLKFKLESGLISDVTYYDETTRLELELDALRNRAKEELEANLANVDNETAREYKRLLGVFRMNDYAALMTWFVKPSSIKRKDYPSRTAYNKAKEAEKQEYVDGVTDLASAEALAKEYVADMETRAGKDATDELWKRINAATKETLKFQQEHGILSRQQVREIGSMMRYYLPMRGFTEDTAETSYMYYLSPRGDGFAPTVLAAKGRHNKKYRNPFGMIGFMHSSAVSQGLRNEAKLALLTLVRNHPTDLVTVSRTWFKKTDEVDNEGKPIFVPVYPEMPEGIATKDREDISKAFEEEMTALKASGEAYKSISDVVKAGGVVAFEQKSHKEEHVVHVREGGTEYDIIINGNPGAAQALNGLAKRSKGVELALGSVDFGRNIQSRFATTYNPRFWILNFIRDNIQGPANAYIRNGFGYLGRYGLNWFRIVPQIGFHVAGAEKLMEKIDPKIAGYYKEFVKNGGPMRQARIMNDEDHNRRIERYIRYRQYDKANAINAAYFVGNLLASVGEATETLVRFVTYVASRESGRPIHQSISDAKEITVNFARHGRRSFSLEDIYTWEYENGRKLYIETESGKKIPTPDALGFLFVSKLAGYFRHAKMFYNPSMQGIDNLRRNFKEHPYRTSLVAATYAAIAFAMMLLRGGDGDDDERDKSHYSHTSDYYRGNNILLPIGDGKYLRIALPQEYREFYKLGDILARAYLQTTPYEKLLNELYEAVVDLGPSGVLSDEAGIVHSMLPSVVTPPQEVHENKNFMGGRIYDTGYYGSDKNYPKWTWALSTTGEGYVEFAKELNRLTGGGDNNDVISGVIDLNPAAIEHYINGYLSGPANIASLAVQNARSQRRGEPVKTKDKVVMGRLIYDTNDYDRDSYYSDMYYYFMDIAEKAESVHAKFKERRGKGDKQVEEFYESKPYKYMLEYKMAEAEVRNMKREMHDAEKNGNAAHAEEMKSKIQRKREEVGRRCLEIYFKGE